MTKKEYLEINIGMKEATLKELKKEALGFETDETFRKVLGALSIQVSFELIYLLKMIELEE